MHSPTFQSFTHPLILFLTLILYFSLSLSLVCTCVRASVSFSLSFSRFCPCILSQAFYLSLSFFITHTLAHTQSHALSHPVTHKRTHASNLYPHLSCTLTQISLSFSLSLSLSLSPTHIHRYTHTLALTHSLTDSRSSNQSLLSCVRAALSSARVRTRAVFSLFLSPFSLPTSFLFRFYLFCSRPPSRSLASSPCIPRLTASPFFAHCESILSLSCPWNFLSNGTVEQKNIGRDKLMRKDRDFLIPAAKFPCVL